MGFRFQKRISILPEININLGKRGASVPVGPRGLKTTISSRGVKHSIGLSGTGIRYETSYGGGSHGSRWTSRVQTLNAKVPVTGYKQPALNKSNQMVDFSLVFGGQCSDEEAIT
jgi:hypothetical protein